ncbi:MAG: DUF3179 domain-containing (seleno)protein [Anaerolineae bacterium]|nr:DUF3179 domain-containing (seleno)protein [Anaerolineae bacterium]
MLRKIGIGLMFVIIMSGCSRLTSASIPDVSEESGILLSPTTIPTSVSEQLTTEDEFLGEDTPPLGAEREFSTDFSRHTVPYSDILSGGPPKDGIPAINTPGYVSVQEADTWLEDLEPVIVVEIGEIQRAYPVQILMWHEIVNDNLNGVPLIVSFCPLCNTAIAFDRRFEDKILDFGTTGRLRFSNLIMYDRQTETWWQQASGKGIVGEFAGQQLAFIPANIVAWADFRDNYPTRDVLSRNTGYVRSYGDNLYPGYDNVENSPFLYQGLETPDTLAAMARVLTVDLNEEAVAYPYEILRQLRVVNDVVGGIPVVVMWQSGTASALDRSTIADGEDVGSAAVFARTLDGQVLTFQIENDVIRDVKTGSTWSVLGRAIAGPLMGQHLDDVVSINHFWFSWAAFKPETRVYTGKTVPSTDEENGEEVPSAPADAENSQDDVATVTHLPADFEITLYQGQDGLGGETVNLSDILAQGKPTVLVFWAGLCPFCRTEMPDMQEAYREFGDRVSFIAIDVGLFTNLGSRADAEALIAELGLTFPSGAILDYQVMPSYEVTAIPTVLFMKPNGVVYRRDNGLIGKNALYERIEALILASGS